MTAQARRRGDQRYHLQVAKATDDDTSPGLPLANYQRARGSLQGSGVDAVDIYRFSLARNSLLRVNLSGNGFKLQLLRDTGHRVASSDDGVIERRAQAGALLPGRPLAAHAVGPLRPPARGAHDHARAHLHQRRALGGRRAGPGRPRRRRGCARRWPGRSGSRSSASTRSPAGSSSGASPCRRATASATLSFTPPSQGRWRATAVYRGTRIAAPSETGYANVLVAPPLTD